MNNNVPFQKSKFPLKERVKAKLYENKVGAYQISLKLRQNFNEVS